MTRVPQKAARILLAGGAIAGIALLAGCTPAPQWDPAVPTVVDTPQIVWENGPPAGEFEDDEAVIAARAASLGRVLAENYHDYTIKQLTDYVAPEELGWMYEADVDDLSPSSPAVLLGPRPLKVTDVIRTGDSTDVVFCAPDFPKATAKDPEFFVDMKNSYVVTYTMQPDDTGSLKLVDIGVLVSECDTSGVAIGRFSPEPVIPDSFPVDGVRPPLGYVKD